ncbi:hypothetical protein EPUL_002428 [Erysiphe pulchra]|uniref:Uncharacterized protein n=1 Tax=Erysiphe pulchra TaxID=225359 RepID=A0A2S4Q041_9PEZI|nr:hypothetical protein EPUL_002428 [Erysiphe pulchra]
MANQSKRWLGIWLGIWLDRKLSFLDHATKWAAKASSVSGFLRRFNNSQRGLSRQLERQAIKACVIPVALYGAETTRLLTLYRESDILPAIELLKHAWTHQALLSLDDLHSLRQRALEQVYTRLTQLANLLPELHDSDMPLLIQDSPSLQEPTIHDIHLCMDGSCQSLDSNRGGYIVYQRD